MMTDIDPYEHFIFCSRKCRANFEINRLTGKDLKAVIRETVKTEHQDGFDSIISEEQLPVFEILFGKIEWD